LSTSKRSTRAAQGDRGGTMLVLCVTRSSYVVSHFSVCMHFLIQFH